MENPTQELVAVINELVANYSPFSHPGNDWRDGGEGLDALVEARDRALENAIPLLDRMKELWALWETASPNAHDRAVVGEARNRLVTLGLDVSRSDIMLERVLSEKIAKLKSLASDSNKKSQASQAYGRASMGGWLS
jgi:hypothetical protein